MATNSTAMAGAGRAEYGIWRVIMASAVGTMIEWYDFYIFGSLAAILSPKFYPPGNETFAYIAYLATFAVGFLVRPFGALFFGRIGDIVGRKYAFIVTLSIMGGATAIIGLLPTYAAAGWFSPIALLLIRVLQGLALGGEYGGAAVYVAEHVPDGKRGFYTSFIQITATLGLFVSLLVDSRYAIFHDQGAVRGLGMAHSLPALDRAGHHLSIHPIEDEGIADLLAAQEFRHDHSKAADRSLLRFGRTSSACLVSLLGATAGQGVVWYTGQFYALFYLQTVLKLNPKHQHHRRHRSALRDALLYGLRRAI